MVKTVSRSEWSRRTEEAKNRRPRKKYQPRILGYDSWTDEPVTIFDYIGLWFLGIGSVASCIAVAYMWLVIR